MNKQKIDLRYFLICILIFVSSMIGGWLAKSDFASFREILRSSIPFIDSIQSFPAGLIFAFILINNIIKSFFVIVLGTLFGFMPLFSLYANGFLIGMLGSFVGEGLSLKMFLASIVPHGIIEVTALVMAASYGLWLGVKLIRWIIHKEPFMPHFKTAMIFYFRVIAPLILLAALIEAFLTPRIIAWTK